MRGDGEAVDGDGVEAVDVVKVSLLVSTRLVDTTEVEVSMATDVILEVSDSTDTVFTGETT
jgi:hypothetical protein